jgi:hypothetical protein
MIIHGDFNVERKAYLDPNKIADRELLDPRKYRHGRMTPLPRPIADYDFILDYNATTGRLYTEAEHIRLGKSSRGVICSQTEAEELLEAEVNRLVISGHEFYIERLLAKPPKQIPMGRAYAVLARAGLLPKPLQIPQMGSVATGSFRLMKLVSMPIRLLY